MTPALRTRGLSKQFRAGFLGGERTALHPTDLELEPGERVGLVGPNGAGKSTLLHLVAGLLRPTAGSAEVFGADIADPEARRPIGLVPDRRALPDRMRVGELLQLCATLSAVPQARAVTADWLDRVGLSERADQRIGTLSSGQRQRLVIAQALLHGPKLLLLDEPLAALDDEGAERVEALIATALDDGATLLLASHRRATVEAQCTRVVRLVDGRLETL